MRKLIALVAVAALAAALPGTAVAGKKPTKISDSFGATLAPFPKLAAMGDPLGLTRPGCTAGQEGVHWVAQEFTAPGKGTLVVSMTGFTGDHDVYIFKDDVPLIRGENAQVPVGSTDIAPPEEEISYTMKKNETIVMVGCNWLGQPDVLVNYEGTFK